MSAYPGACFDLWSEKFIDHNPGAASSINNPNYLTVVASILTVEACYNAFIRGINWLSPFPSIEDTLYQSSPWLLRSSLAVLIVVSLQFILTPTGETALGAEIKASLDPSALSGLGLSIAYFEYKDGECTIFKDILISNGQVYVFVTNTNTKKLDP